MDARELRIGNLVWLKSKEKPYEISGGHDIEEIDDAPENFDAEPIPLSETWLYKFGFDYYPNLGRRKFMNFGNLIVETNAHDNFPVYYTHQKELICFIHHVHQLQNLFYALVGQELTLTDKA